MVVRRGDELLDHFTLVRAGTDELPGRAYLREVALAVLRAIERYGVEEAAVEGVQKPSPFMGASGNVSFSNVSGILGTAMVFGVVVALVPSFVVPPGKNGKGPLLAYPAELQPTRGLGKGTDKLRHERSAWDVAGVDRRLCAISA